MFSLFSGPYFDYVMSQEPLCGAEYFAHGSFSMLFKRDGRLYRITTDGCGHNFLSEQYAMGNPKVVRVIQDFGPMAPTDEDGVSDEFYWLSEVEWLEPVDPESAVGRFLDQLFKVLTDCDHVEPERREQFIDRCKTAVSTHKEYADLLNTLIAAAHYLPAHDGTVDANITNVMRRPSTGEVVWTDPVHYALAEMTDDQEAEMERIREQVNQQKVSAADAGAPTSDPL